MPSDAVAYSDHDWTIYTSMHRHLSTKDTQHIHSSYVADIDGGRRHFPNGIDGDSTVDVFVCSPPSSLVPHER